MSSVARTGSRLALLGTLLMLMLVSVSAYLRLSAAGLGCEPWPACYAQAAETLERQNHPVARLVHRVLASTVGVIVLLVAYADLARGKGGPRRIVRGVLLVMLIVALAGLGWITPGSTSLAIALGNLLGGAALAAVLWWAALDQRGSTIGLAGVQAKTASMRVRGLAYATVALVIVQFVLGAMLSTTMGASACATTPLCTQDIPTNATTLHLAHRLLAVTLTFVVGALAIVLLRSRGRARWCAAALGIVLLLQGAAGAAMLVFGFPLWLGLAHNLFGVLLLLAVLTATRV